MSTKLKTNPVATTYSNHARLRIQQRSIPEGIIDLLIDFGECYPAGSNAERYYFTKSSWRKAAEYLGKKDSASLERYARTYAILSGDGCVITAGWKH